MNKEKLKRYLLDFQERKFPNLIRREIRIKDSNKIQTVIGARRVGKTFLLFNKISSLERKGIKREQIVYLNFETPILNDITYKEVKDIIELQWSLFPKTIRQTLYLFIDEPQTIEKWELAIRELHDDYNCRIFITGSSSKLLSKEIATSLRGRSITITLLSLSFKEFLQFNRFNVETDKISTKIKAQIMHYLERYLEFGGYPEIAPEEDKNEKLKILKDYFDLIIYKDLVDRYAIKNTQLIKWLINYLTSSITKEVSLNRIYLDLKSRGIKLSKNTLYEYFSMLEDSFFIFTLRKFEYSPKKEMLSIPKIYLDDIGFLNLFSERDYGKRMENIVFLHLSMRRYKHPLMEIHYWKNSAEKEVDFLVSERKKVKSAIQVCYNIEDIKTKEREISSLIDCLTQFKLKEGTIITKNHEKEEMIKGKKIRFIPLWKWLLK